MTALRVQYRRSPADMQSRIHPSSAGPPGDRHEQQATHDPQRSVCGNPGRPGREGRLRHRRLGLHGRARPVSGGGHPLRADGARAGRGAHGRRLFAGDGPARRLHRAERSGHHQFRDGRGGGLLGAQPGGGDHARDRHVRHGPGRLPGNRATADLLAHHQVPGARQPRRPHGRVHGQGFRQRHGRARPGAAEHPARLLLWRDRRGDSRAAPRASRSGRRGRPGGGGQAAGRGALPGDRGRRRRCSRTGRPSAWRWPSCWAHRW